MAKSGDKVHTEKENKMANKKKEKEEKDQEMFEDLVEGKGEVLHPSATIELYQGGDAGIMPAMSLEESKERYDLMKELVASILIEGVDHGTIPGTQKPTLYKPGAEKLTTFFGLSVRFVSVTKKEIWEDGNVLFFYHEKCQLFRGNLLIAEADGSANSNEARYRWRWVREEALPVGVTEAAKKKLEVKKTTTTEFDFAIQKRTTSGDYGKPESYWQKWDKAHDEKRAKPIKIMTRKGDELDGWEMEDVVYRIPNEDIFSLVNTILKMAQKRSLVAATLIACNASDFFTQDLEDMGSAIVPAARVSDSSPKDATPKKGASKKFNPADVDGAIADIGEMLMQKKPLTATEFWKLAKLAKIDDQFTDELLKEYTMKDENGNEITDPDRNDQPVINWTEATRQLVRVIQDLK